MGVKNILNGGIIIKNSKIIFVLVLFSFISGASAFMEPHDGFPVNLGGEQISSVTDIDNDGNLEIISTTYDSATNVVDYNGILKWSTGTYVSQGENWRFPIVRNLSGDDRLEILSTGTILQQDGFGYDWVMDIWDASGVKLNRIFVGNYLTTSPGITKDGIILIGADWPTNELQAFDILGTKLWYLGLDKDLSYYKPITTGDIDGDGNDEAIVPSASADGKVWVIKVEKDKGTVLWSIYLGDYARSATISDVNGDGSNELIALSSSGLYFFDRSGILLNNFSINSQYASNGPLAIGDLDGNGINEVVLASHPDKEMYIISQGNLSRFSTNPSSGTGGTGRIASTIGLGDINDDGKMEIAAGDLLDNMYLWDLNGSLLWQTNTRGEYVNYFTSAFIADLENDGNKEVIMGKPGGSIFVFTYRKDINPPTTTASLMGEAGFGDWYISDVTVTLESVDDLSGVAKTEYNIDNATWLPYSTSFVIGNEGITTLQYRSVDNEGNVEPVKTLVIKIDKTLPQIAINSPANGSVYVLNQTLSADWSAEDYISGVAWAAGTAPNGSAVDTGTVGSKTFIVNVSDNAGHTTNKTAAYYVRYRYGGILEPINADDSSIFNSNKNSIIPVKFQLQDATSSYVAGAFVEIYPTKINNNITGTFHEDVVSGTATSGNRFIYNSTTNEYVFNLASSGLSVGTWRIEIRLDDGTSKYVNISIK